MDAAPYLNPGLPTPIASRDGLDHQFWDGLRNEQLWIQQCISCERFQWGPEWICHRCRSFDLQFNMVEAHGLIYSHQRVWHPVHPALTDQGPYIVVLVELPHADGVRLVGNLVGDPHQDLVIGAPVSAVFEHHTDTEHPHTLLQWTLN